MYFVSSGVKGLKVWRMYFLNLGVKGLNNHAPWFYLTTTVQCDYQGISSSPVAWYILSSFWLSLLWKEHIIDSHHSPRRGEGGTL